MTRQQAQKHQLQLQPVETARHEAKIVSHPALFSMGQVLSGKGHLAFEGELLDSEISWHPTGTKH